MSQTGLQQNLITYAKNAKSYIEDLERKIWYLEQLLGRECASPDTQKLAAEIEDPVARPERPHTVSSEAPIGAWDGVIPEKEAYENQDAWWQDWTEDEMHEWYAWKAEKESVPLERLCAEESEWEEDAQPLM